ncbi:hypothetical protein R6L23_32355 [Streptomyces sp. SR27]|nr:hypothetical protein [Streptomyces sp. SR27]MDV9192847.1 hypothetical protein [Streptomyces sp. SR27]
MNATADARAVVHRGVGHEDHVATPKVPHRTNADVAALPADGIRNRGTTP